MLRCSLFAILTLLVALPAGAQEVGVSQNEILVGSCADLAGTGKTRSLQLLDGARAFIDSVNAGGGVYGRKIHLLSFDDAGDPKQAVACFNRLRDQGVFAGAFFLSSPPASRYAPMAEYNRIPVLGFVAGARFLYEPVKHYVFPVHPSHREMISSVIEGAAKELGIDPQKVGILEEENAFGKSVGDAVVWALSKRGATPCESVTLSPKSKDYKSAIEPLKACGAQLVILGVGGATTGEFIRECKAEGWSPLFVAVSNDPSIYESAASVLDGTIILQPFPTPDAKLPTAAAYVRHLKKYARRAVPSMTGLEGYVSAMVFVEGLKRAGRSLTRDKFVDALESIQNLDLGLGPEYRLTYTTDSHTGISAMAPTVVRGGKEMPFDWKTLRSNPKVAR